jgi:hypothetical protein
MNEVAIWIVLAAAAMIAIAFTRINPIHGYSRRWSAGLVLLVVLVAVLMAAAIWLVVPPGFTMKVAGAAGR